MKILEAGAGDSQKLLAIQNELKQTMLAVSHLVGSLSD